VGGTWHIMTPIRKSVGGHVPRVPHQIAPMTGQQNYSPVVKIFRPVSANLSHRAALKFCTALQNLLHFVVTSKNHTCASPEVTHSFKLRRTLWHYMLVMHQRALSMFEQKLRLLLSDHNQARVQRRWRFDCTRSGGEQVAFASARERKMSHKQLKQKTLVLFVERYRTTNKL